MQTQPQFGGGLQQLLPWGSKRAPAAHVPAMGARNGTRAGGEAEPSGAARGGTSPRARCLPPCRGRQEMSQHTPAPPQPISLLHTCTGGPRDGKERGASRRGLGTGQPCGGMGRKEGTQPPPAGSLPLAFISAQEKKDFSLPGFFFPASPAAAGETPSQATPSPWQRAERNRWSW